MKILNVLQAIVVLALMQGVVCAVVVGFCF